MNKGPVEGATDRLLRESISYQLYMRKKEPLEGVEAKKRLGEGSWKSEGVDIDVLERRERIPKGCHVPEILFDVERIKVRSGLFGLRSEHRISKGLRPLSGLIGQVDEERLKAEGKPSSDLDAIMGSELLFPLFLRTGSPIMTSIVRGLVLKGTVQTNPGDLSPEAAFRKFVSPSWEIAPGDEAMEAVFRPLKGVQRQLFTGRSDHRDLASAMFSLFELDDERLSRTATSGELQSFCREALHNPYLEALMEDLATGPDGNPEAPDRYRARLGRVIMESGVGERFHQRFVLPYLHRLLTCSTGESERLRSVLSPLMESRSTPVLLDLLFKVPQENRPAVLGLVGATKDKSAAEPLKRMLDYSNVESDRRAAQEALIEIGTEPLRKAPFP